MDPLDLDHLVAAKSASRRRACRLAAERLGRPLAGLEAADQGMEVDEDTPQTPPLAFHLIYRDARQHFSGRCVTLCGARCGEEDVRLTAYCHVREEPRAFLASRIVEATDLTTGEIHADAVDFFRRHPVLRMAADAAFRSPSPELRAIYARRHEIIILALVGARDGDLDASGVEHIVQHVLAHSDEGVDPGKVRGFLQCWAPDERAFERAMSRLRREPDAARALLGSLNRLIDRGARLSGDDIAFIREVGDQLQA